MSLRAAILGAGGMGKKHAQSLAKMEGVAVCAVCDIQKDSLSVFEQLYGANTYIDFREMLDKENPDMLFVCLPPFAHHGEVEMAAERGIHIFLEKPLALSMSQAENMVKAVEKNGVISQVGYHYRFGAAVRHMRSLIEQGKAGKPVLFNGQYECNSLHSPWWRKKDLSGSQMLEQAIHLYDMAVYFLGTPDTAVGHMANLCHTEVPEYTVEDVSASLIRFRNGAIGTISATNCAVPGIWKNPFTLVFEKVTAHFSDPNHAEFWETSEENPEKSVITSNTDMYEDEVQAFIKAVVEGTASPCPIEEGLKSLSLIAQIMKNNEKGVL